MVKKIREIQIKPAKNGGHTVTHHYRETPQHNSKSGMTMAYVEPEQHVFGPSDGHAMLAHVANHLEIPEHEDGE